MDHRGRQQRLQDSLSNHRLDVLLVAHPPNIRYLFGFTFSSFILVLKCKFRVLFTDGRYT
jgi:Xaa-Pro aminopeptidase